MEKKKLVTCFVSAILILCGVVVQVRSDASDHRYKVADDVPLYANKVGPFHNPRCGYEFCYTCSAEWKNKKSTCSCPLWDEDHILYDDDDDDGDSAEDGDDEYYESDSDEY